MQTRAIRLGSSYQNEAIKVDSEKDEAIDFLCVRKRRLRHKV